MNTTITAPAVQSELTQEMKFEVRHAGGVNVRHAIMVGLPLGVAACGGIVARGFFAHALSSNPALNLLILGMLSWGVYTMVEHLRRLFQEQRLFEEGLRWLRGGPWSGEQDPRLGPRMCVTGMLERLRKLGLGHQIFMHASAMDPEIDALEHALLKRQDLSQFLVGLMVGLGLLGTFIGLLETLVKTSELIGQIGGSMNGGDMAASFSRIVGGLQRPLSAMGTAFSASMFGLVGSILLGFQMVAVRKATSDFIEHVRHEVQALAQRVKAVEKVEITERFLATLLADILEQHRSSSRSFASMMGQMDVVAGAIQSAGSIQRELVTTLHQQHGALAELVTKLNGVSHLTPAVVELTKGMSSMAQNVSEVAKGVIDARLEIAQANMPLPRQMEMARNVHSSATAAAEQAEAVGKILASIEELRLNLAAQGELLVSLDSKVKQRRKRRLRSLLRWRHF